MGKHQKRALISNICITGGIILPILGIILINIFGFCITNKNLAGKLIIIVVVFILIGMILLFIATRINANYFPYFLFMRTHLLPPSIEHFAFAGVPNNSFLEFDIPITKNLPDVLQSQEIEKGIYEINIEEKKYTFDMKGWIHKEYYIYEIILAKIQTKYMSKKKIKCLCKSLQINEINNLRLEFTRLNGKKKKYKLIENGKTKLLLKFKKNMQRKIIFYQNEKKLILKPYMLFINEKHFYIFYLLFK